MNLTYYISSSSSFFVLDLVKMDIYYAIKKIPRDLFDFPEAENSELYWRDPIDGDYNTPNTFTGDDSRSREDVNMTIVNIETILDHDQNMDKEFDDSDFDDTYWDWKRAKTLRSP